MIVFRGVRKSFGSIPVLRGVDLEVSPGETLTVLGRSGTGKSVLVSMLVGLERPDEGSICIGGVEVSRFKREEDWYPLRMKIGFLFQGSALYDSMTVLENVAFPLIHRGDLSREDVLSLVRRRLRQVELDESVEEKYPSELSGGMQRRVALARTLMLSPKILIYDEPTAGLDPITSDGIGQLIRHIQRRSRATSVVVTHDVRLAARVSNRVAVLEEGRVIQVGPLAELVRSDHAGVRAFFRRSGGRGETRGPLRV
jgi:phospholipid/cholesterol/gamma-HCH transport system ATP-binding protein